MNLLGLSKRVKVLVVIAVIVVATFAGGYYYWETRPTLEFTLSVSPTFFHVGVREGKLLNVSITRAPGYTAQVQVSLLNPPDYVVGATQTLGPNEPNASLPVFATYNAPMGDVSLTIVAAGQGALDQYTPVDMKIVGVQNYSSSNGNATIYDTTKGLDAATKQVLVSYTNGTLTFSHETPLLQNLTRGDVLIAGISPPVAPLGFFRLVLSVTQENGMVVVQTTRASILDAVQEIHVQTYAGNNTGGSAGSMGVSCVICLGSTVPIIPETTLTPPGLPLNWGAITADASVSFGAGVDYRLDVSLHWPGWTQIVQAGICFANSGGNLIAAVACGIAQVDDAHFYLNANAAAEADITGTPGSVNTGPTDLIPAQDCSSLGVPNSVISCISPIPLFSVGPVGVNMGVGFRFVGGATGQLSTSFTVKVSQQLAISIGPEYSNGGFSFQNVVTNNPTKEVNINVAGNNYLKLYAGPEVTISVDADAGLNLEVGLSAALHAFVEFQSQIPNNPVWWINGGIEGCVDINVSAFLIGNWNPPEACAPLLSVRIGQQNPTQNPLPPATPALVIMPQDQTIDLSNPAFIDPNLMSSWTGLVPEDPQMSTSITCLWYTNLGPMGTSQAQVIGNSINTACHGPSLQYFPTNQIITQSVTQLKVYIIAEDSYGAKSPQSNTVTVSLILPTPVLHMLYPTNGTAITENQAFNGVGTATVSTVVSNSNPDGIIHLCATQPQNIVWFVGGQFEANIVDVGEGAWVGAESSGVGCNSYPSLTATSTGQTTIYMALLSTDPQTHNQYIAQTSDDDNANPLNVVVAIVYVQPQIVTTQTAQAGAPLVVQIVPPFAQYSSSTVTASSGPVELTGSVTGGTPPYTVAWTAQFSWNGQQTVTITKGGPDVLNYAWNVCNSLTPYAGTANVFLSASDSQGNTGNAGPVGVTFNCEVAQSLPPPPGFEATLVTLLTVWFAVTSERITMTTKKTWRRKSIFGSYLDFTANSVLVM